MGNQLEKDYKVIVICTTENGNPQRVGKVKYTDNIDIYYVDQKMYDGTKFYTRAIHELFYAGKIVTKSLRVSSDATIITSPSMFLIPISALLIRGKKIIDIRDLVWEYMSETSLYSKILKKQITFLIKKSLNTFSHVSVTNNYETQWIKENINCNDPLKVTNGIESSKFEALEKLEPKKLDKFTITYVGNVGIAQHIETLVDAAKMLKDIQVNIVGGGSRYTQVKNYVKKQQISNVEFFGQVPREKMIDFYSNSSILYAQLDEKFKAAMPSKLYEYVSTGLPIIYGGTGEARNFINKLENCYAITPKDPNILKSTIEKYLDKEIEISEKNRNFIKENFIRETQSQKMVDLVDTLLNKNQEKDI
jgi:glycosyltransferase involved in cell wall biosynthesis